MSTNKRILVAVDDSEASRSVVDYVAEIFRGNAGMHVGLLHLELPPKMLEWGGSEDPGVEARVSRERAAAYQEMETKVIDRGRSLVQELHGILTRHGIDVTAGLVEFEEPLDAETIAGHILDCALDQDYRTVVVGRHSFSHLKRLFHRDVAEHLLDKSKGLAVWIVE
jgi:nucleotide-binding universal stress UspA family protein